MPVYRSTYHYGNLRAALTEAALDLARRGGPASVTVRGVARLVGVTPPAAYRHFAEVRELQDATKDRALALLSEGIDEAIGRITVPADPAVAAAARVRAVAEGYVAFAQSSPGLFAMACHGTVDTIRALMADRLDPFLDVLCVRRPGMGFALWSAVHALAVLTMEGPAPEGACAPAVPTVSAEEVLDTVLAWIAGGVLGECVAAAAEVPETTSAA
jgi:AcrR family transcriptional regulator